MQIDASRNFLVKEFLGLYANDLGKFGAVWFCESIALTGLPALVRLRIAYAHIRALNSHLIVAEYAAETRIVGVFFL